VIGIKFRAVSCDYSPDRWAALPASKEKSPPDRSPPGNWSPDKDKRPSFSAAEKPEQEWRSQDVEATKRDIYYGGFKPVRCSLMMP